MVRINKRTQIPPLLLKDIKDGAKIYSSDLGSRTMVELRKTLMEDQGFICCYCQKRIPHKFTPKSKIEHFKSQSEYPQFQLKFKNLFIACNGIGYINDATCDSKKGDTEIKSFNLITTNFLNKIKYTKIGTIISDDEKINNDLKNTLNLNDQNIRKARLQVYDAIETIKKLCHKKGVYDQKIKIVKSEWSNKDIDGKYKPFYGVALYYLK